MVKESDMGEGEVGEDERIWLFTSEGTEVVEPGAVAIQLSAPRQSPGHAFLTELAPALEDELEVMRPVIDIVIGQKNTLRLICGIGPEFLVEAVASGLSISDSDAVFSGVCGWRLVVKVVPNDNNLV